MKAIKEVLISVFIALLVLTIIGAGMNSFTHELAKAIVQDQQNSPN
jgi:hypothetical protein